MSELYPLKFEPIFKYRIWGGQKLKSVLHKDINEDLIGESWEISDVQEDVSVVANGKERGKSLKEIIEKYKEQLLGSKVYERFGTDFPVLIKFIDAELPLSVQVHPHDDLAKERHDSFGKNEMWYIMDADQDAELILGFSEDIDAATFKEALRKGNITEILNKVPVSSGDTFYIPTGRVHAIGAGILLAEIQQTSDITYRIYDYDRIDKKTGTKRDLHIEQAIDTIDYKRLKDYKTSYDLIINQPETLVHSPYFKTDILEVSGALERDYSNKDSYIILIGVEGETSFAYKEEQYHLKRGQTFLLPATIEQIYYHSPSRAKVIEVYHD